MIEKGAKIAEDEKTSVMNKIVESSLPNNGKGDAKTRLTKAIVTQAKLAEETPPETTQKASEIKKDEKEV